MESLVSIPKSTLMSIPVYPKRGSFKTLFFLVEHLYSLKASFTVPMYLKAITHNRNDWIIHQCFSNLLNDGTCLVDATSDAICNQFSISRVSAIGSNTLKWKRIRSVLLNKRNQRGRKTTSATRETEDLRKRAGKGGNVRAEGSGRRSEEEGGLLTGSPGLNILSNHPGLVQSERSRRWPFLCSTHSDQL